MTKEDALKLLEDLKNSANMVKHGLAAGFAMAAFYGYFQNRGDKPELTEQDWLTVGFLHDADYEITNKSLELHTEETTKKLKEKNINQIVIDAIRGHCDKELRKTLIAKSIYACDELTGLIVAAALVQPEQKLKSVGTESVMKKFKDKSFAAGANRGQILTCETELKIPLAEFIEINLNAMQDRSEELGL